MICLYKRESRRYKWKILIIGKVNKYFPHTRPEDRTGQSINLETGEQHKWTHLESSKKNQETSTMVQLDCRLIQKKKCNKNLGQRIWSESRTVDTHDTQNLQTADTEIRNHKSARYNCKLLKKKIGCKCTAQKKKIRRWKRMLRRRKYDPKYWMAQSIALGNNFYHTGHQMIVRYTWNQRIWKRKIKAQHVRRCHSKISTKKNLETDNWEQDHTEK